ncbi:LAM0-like protein [Mya arenaria]|uniref:LAM0-like protein n=1 Tax=Mya arenaria TaxID=6604 RepID=A0ABY7DT51_MYAAR|nr:LAM0-like protein [Mya arenaria]
MAARQSRKSITTTTVSQSTSAETPTTSGTFSGRRGRSPSPARITRMQEKEQLQNLNDRLAAYIDRVRYLESENSRLQVQVRSTEETVTREVTNIKSLYESELAEARKHLDDTAKDKAKQQLEADKYKTEADDWKTKYLKRERDAKNAEKRNLELEALLGDAKARLQDAENNRKHAEAESARLRGELANLERQMATLRKQLEEETLLRVDLENRIQTLKEELAFKSQIHEQTDTGLRADYENKLQDALQQTRMEYEEQIRVVREEVEDLYDRKVNDLQGALDRSMTVGNSSREEYILIKRRVDELQSEVTKLKAQLASEQDLYEQRLLQKDNEIMDLRLALSDQTQEYADLLDIKLRLDSEIEAYRKLLESEEDRLNLSATSQESTPKKGRGTKRKRVTLDVAEETGSGYDFASEASAKGAIEIHDTDHDGKFIKLFNTGEDDVVLGGWVLRHSAGDKETVYKFHRNLKLNAGHFVTVWSSNAGQTHSPPTDLVMKGQQWFTAEEMKTVLLHEDQEMATRELKKTVKRVSRIYRTHREGDEVDGQGERCSIM